jgi:hypothetical protein
MLQTVVQAAMQLAARQLPVFLLLLLLLLLLLYLVLLLLLLLLQGPSSAPGPCWRIR